MTQPIINGIPGYLSPAEAAKRLDMSRALFYRYKLHLSMTRHMVGKSILYAKVDVDNLERWLFIRRGLIALGRWDRERSRVSSADDLRHVLWMEIRWVSSCPICGGDAVAELTDFKRRSWCPDCGITTRGDHQQQPAPAEIAQKPRTHGVQPF